MARIAVRSGRHVVVLPPYGDVEPTTYELPYTLERDALERVAVKMLWVLETQPVARNALEELGMIAEFSSPSAPRVQKIEIIVRGSDDPSRVARLVLEKLSEIDGNTPGTI